MRALSDLLFFSMFLRGSDRGPDAAMSDWTTQYQITTKAFKFEGSDESFLACIGGIQEGDTECLRFFRFDPALSLKDLINREHYIGRIDAVLERVAPADLIEILGRRDQYVRAQKGGGPGASQKAGG